MVISGQVQFVVRVDINMKKLSIFIVSLLLTLCFSANFMQVHADEAQQGSGLVSLTVTS